MQSNPFRYFFDQTVKSNTECMRTSISARDLSDSKGVATTRQPFFSPM